MTVLVVGRAEHVVDTVLAAIRAHGFDAIGVTEDADAVTHLGSGSIAALVIAACRKARARRSGTEPTRTA